MTKNLEIVTITTKEVSVTVKIDYENMKISLVDESYLPKKWLFAERQLDCIESCTNDDKNLREDEIHVAIENLLSNIKFTDEELLELEANAKFGLANVSKKREKELDDLNQQRKKLHADLDYIISNKISLLRNNTMDMTEIKDEEKKLNKKIDEIDEKIMAYKDAAGEMLKYIITFSELVNNANIYYKYALDSEKRELATQVFTELIFSGGKLASFKAKEGFDALLNRHYNDSGSRC